MKIHGKTVEPGPLPVLMGILNMTPDSFSDGGETGSPEQRIRRLLDGDAQIIDIGGESTRPGAEEIPEDEEIRRIRPALEVMRRCFPSVMVSVDTRKGAVAEAAMAIGCDILNDVSGLAFDGDRLLRAAAKGKGGVVLMHMRGTPDVMQDHAVYGDLVSEISGFLRDAADRALRAGIARENILLDPGIGFAKTPEQCLEVIRQGPEFAKLDFPLLAGLSRKRFIGELTGIPEPAERDFGTCGGVIAAAECGYDYIRVHNPAACSAALKVWAAVRKNA